MPGDSVQQCSSPAVQQCVSPVFYRASTPPIGPREVGKSSERLGKVRRVWERLGGVGRGSDPAPRRPMPCPNPCSRATSWAGQSQKVPGPSRHSRRVRGPSGSSIRLPQHTSTGSGDLQALSEGPGTFRKQRQTTGFDAKMTEIMKIVGNGLRRLEMG